MDKFEYERELNIALNSNSLTKKLAIRGYADIHNRDDVHVLRENKSDLLFVLKGERDLAFVNVNCKSGRIKMKVIKMSKNLLSKATDFVKKGGIHEY